MAKPTVSGTIANLLASLQNDHPQIVFRAGDTYCWSPADQQVIYKQHDRGPTAAYSLLHELGHALLAHRNYTLDFELLSLEIAAWDKARQLAAHYGIAIDDDHIEDCLDTYRDWLYGRSVCPRCSTKTLQHDNPANTGIAANYRCYNCHATWKVAPSRFCRPYRAQQSQPQHDAVIFA